MEHYTAIKRNKILPFAKTWMDLKGIMLSEIRQKKKILCFHLYVEFKKIKEMNGYNKTETDSQRTNYWLPLGRGMRGRTR